MAALLLGGIGAGIGATIGGTFLGMSAASIGWSIGSMAGNMLFGQGGQDIKGPRLNDKSVSTSAYGNMRPKIYGTYRVGAEIIWSTNLVEHKHTEEAGKGGGGGGSYTSYTYTVSFAAALCAGEIAGVRKIWMDSKLVYTAAEDATKKELQKSDKMAKRLAFHLGTETQTADATIEESLGVGNAPAYRGTAYIVFDNLDVTKYGNRIPVITVEVVASGTAGYVENVPLNITYNGGRQAIYVKNGVAKCYSYGYTWDGSDASLKKFQQRTIGLDGTILKKKTKTISDEGPLPFSYPQSLSPSMEFALGLVNYYSGGTNYLMAWYSGPTLAYGGVLPGLGNWKNFRNGDDKSHNIIWYDDYTFFVYKANSGRLLKYEFKLVISILGMSYFLDLAWECQVDERLEGTDPLGSGKRFCIDMNSGECYCQIATYTGTDNAVRRISAAGEIIETKFLVTGIGSGAVDTGSYSAPMGFDNGLLWAMTNSARNIETWDWATETKLNDMVVTDDSADGTPVVYVSGNLMVILLHDEIYTAARTMTRNPEGLDVVVRDICETANVASGDIDVTDLSGDSVHGFMISQQGQARAALEQLAPAYFFDCVDTGEQLKFVKRGGAIVETISDDDLGCYGESEAPSQLSIATRTQEEELPKALTLLYADYDADYQQGGQHSLRQSVLAGTEITIQAPLALTGTIGKTIADTLMFSAWHNRHQFRLKTWQKYAALEPCDVISARGETLRITNRSEGINGQVELDAVRELPEIYTGQVGSAAVSGIAQQSVEVGGPTIFELLDIPCLRDEDYQNNGMYWAAAGMLSDWSGATLLKSSDNGDTWAGLGTIDTDAVIGECNTTLGDFNGGNIFDELNVFRVTVNSTLESKTWDQVLSEANVALVGDEIIQFRTATLITTGVYDLSGLLRGRRGTEWAMDEHGENERFVLLSSDATRWVSLQSTDYNSSRFYGALTFGDTIEDVETEYLAYSAQNMKPFAPVYASAGIDESENVEISWIRRVPMDSYWIDGRDAGLNMPDPSYNLYLYSDAGYTTLVRTELALSSASYTYAAADRTTDGNLGDYTYLKVVEVHGSVTGEPLYATLLHNYVTFVPEYMTEALALSPAGAWKFDNTSGTTATDSSGNARHGTYTGGYTLSSDALVVSVPGEYSVGLNGSTGYISVPDNAAWEGAFTFICTIHPTSAALGCLFHHGDTSVGSNQGKYCIRNVNGTIKFGFFNGSFIEYTTTAIASINASTLVIVRYNGTTTLTITVGSISQTFTMSAAVLTTSYTLKIGALKQTSISNFFRGRIDDAVWFSRALTDGEIYNLRT